MRICLIFLVVLLAAVAVSAQGGGKAEPNRIEFASGKTSAALTGTLSRDQEMEYVFHAAKGQTVKIRNFRSGLFDFRVHSEEFDFETEFDSSPTLTFVIPGSGDYNLYVRKKRVQASRRARFSLAIAIN
jgi:hypothetical protein